MLTPCVPLHKWSVLSVYSQCTHRIQCILKLGTRIPVCTFFFFQKTHIQMSKMLVNYFVWRENVPFSSHFAPSRPMSTLVSHNKYTWFFLASIFSVWSLSHIKLIQSGLNHDLGSTTDHSTMWSSTGSHTQNEISMKMVNLDLSF